MFSEEVPGVFSVASRFVDGKNGLVFGTRGALAIDGSNYVDEGQAMADFIRRQGHELLGLALTHGHGDHILGAAPLAKGEIYAHVLTPEVIEGQIPRFARRWEVSPAEARQRVIGPTIRFRDELWIDLGGKTVWVFPTPGHSRDGVSLYIVEDRLLFAGDSVVNGIVAAIGDGDSRVLEDSLRRLLALDIEVLVPGHGHTLHGAALVRDWLEWQAGYLAQVRQRVGQGLDRGQSAEEAAEAIDFAGFIGDRLPADRNQMPRRHRNTVEKIVAEEVKARGAGKSS